MNKLCLALLIAFAVPTIASAGGGGSKATGSITFKNTGTNDVYVIVDPPAVVTVANFFNVGGRLLKAAESTTFGSLKSGKHTYASLSKAAGVVPTDAEIKAAKVVSVNIAGGQALNVQLK